MDALDYWRLSDHLSIVQAALLVCGCDPSEFQDTIEGIEAEERPPGYDAAKSAISNALKIETLDGHLIHFEQFDPMAEMIVENPDTADPTESTVEVESLRSWLKKKGFTTGFFFSSSPLNDNPDYLNPDHIRYAPKLAAAVNAWLACGDESVTQGKSVKQALMKWLRENASQFGLSNDDGNPNELGIEETAKVANWQPTGGAPKTPGG